MNATSAPNEPRDPDNFSLHTRLTVLETRFDVVLPTLATKQDLSMLQLRISEELRSEISQLDVKIEKVRSDLQKSISSMQKWMAGLVVSVLISFVGTTVGFLSMTYQISARLALAPTIAAHGALPASIPPAVKSAAEQMQGRADRHLLE